VLCLVYASNNTLLNCILSLCTNVLSIWYVDNLESLKIAGTENMMMMQYLMCYTNPVDKL